MQFVTNGPDIPNALLQAHEEGRVVFFCGAGISYPAGLPGFQGLVDAIYEGVGTVRTDIEEKAYTNNQFDATLDLLERRLPGQRIAVRKVLAQALRPQWRNKGATDSHAALLQLARGREGSVRLVTTNFDRVFERAAKRTKQAFNAYAAPMLPIPKSSRWNGVVYLHGQLPEQADDSALHRLVLTSGDFGLAYLTERWAARFVSELFRNYVVCFVGYSINDPVLRYMMDALAADRMLGEVTPQAYALGDCSSGQERIKTLEWEAKGVTPVLYEVPDGSHDHSALHKTLATWAAIYRDGVLGNERIVEEHALANPSASTRQDDYVGRMLWALSDPSGLPAKRFADFNLVPSITWLEEFSKERYLHSDLNRFGVPPQAVVDDKLRFSLIHRPAPYGRAPRMALVSGSVTSTHWDDVMFHLARWLIRHLNDPALIIWLAQRGAQLQDRWRWLIEHELQRFASLAQEGKTTELDAIRTNAPNAIPGRRMQVLWRLLLAGRVKSYGLEADLNGWTTRLKRDGLTASLRLELRDLLSPKVTLKKPFHWNVEEAGAGEPSNIGQLVNWDLVLTADHVHSALPNLADGHWRNALPLLLDDFQQLLRDALDVMRELGAADERQDLSYMLLPSISPHSQNRGFCEWVSLIELLRDAWLETLTTDPHRAHRVALAWFDLPYSSFKRLALFTASQDGCVEPAQWVDCLVGDSAGWLWSTETRRETMRLLVLQGQKLLPSDRTRLEAAMLVGPPREMYLVDLEPEEWQQLKDDLVWLYLAKLREGGSPLGEAAEQRLNALSTAWPEKQLACDERDEFSSWMTGTGDPDYDAHRDVDVAPRRRSELVAWLKQPARERRPFYEDTWRESCQTRFFHSFLALCDLTQEEIWPPGRWQTALQVWAAEGKVLRSWRYAAPLVLRMPDSVMRGIVHSVTWWINTVSKSIDRHEAILLGLCHRVMALPEEPSIGIRQNGEPIKKLVAEAINHPIGHATQALLNLCFKRKPGDNDALPRDIEPFFTQLCDVRVERYRHGRVLLASNLIALFRVDRAWTEANLLPLFDWDRNSVEAQAAWEGYLWSPRLYQPLLMSFKAQFLATAHHYTDLVEHGGQFAAILAHAALALVDGYTPAEFQVALAALPPDGLSEVARALSQALEIAGEQREDYWRNRVQPFWHRIWPKSKILVADSIAKSLARLCLAAGTEFPAALSAVVEWLSPMEHPDYVVDVLHQANHCSRFPDAALRLLDAILGNQSRVPGKLGQCLDAIVQAESGLSQDLRFQRLTVYARRRA